MGGDHYLEELAYDRDLNLLTIDSYIAFWRGDAEAFDIHACDDKYAHFLKPIHVLCDSNSETWQIVLRKQNWETIIDFEVEIQG